MLSNQNKAFRRDIQVAWDLLHILTDDYQKIYTLSQELNVRYNLKISNSYLQNIIHQLSLSALVETRKANGIKRVRRRIFLVDVMRSLGVQLTYSTNTPSGRALSKLDDYLSRIEMEYNYVK